MCGRQYSTNRRPVDATVSHRCPVGGLTPGRGRRRPEKRVQDLHIPGIYKNSGFA
jgi:hypothetical protein